MWCNEVKTAKFAFLLSKIQPSLSLDASEREAATYDFQSNLIGLI
jgi:hypothetical protein